MKLFEDFYVVESSGQYLTINDCGYGYTSCNSWLFDGNIKNAQHFSKIEHAHSAIKQYMANAKNVNKPFAIIKCETNMETVDVIF